MDSLKFKTYRHIKTDEFAYVEVNANNKINRVSAYWITSPIPNLFPLTHTMEEYRKYLEQIVTEWEDEPKWEDYELIQVEVLKH